MCGVVGVVMLRAELMKLVGEWVLSNVKGGDEVSVELVSRRPGTRSMLSVAVVLK